MTGNWSMKSNREHAVYEKYMYIEKYQILESKNFQVKQPLSKLLL